jgi:hypothetical protein
VELPMRALATLILPVLVAAAGSALADGTPFTRLTGKDIRAKVIGKVVTDGAHWSDYFEKGGVLVSWSIGRKHTGKWEIRGDELCVTEAAGESPTCYEVWSAGDEISLRLQGIETTFTGYLRRYQGP